MPIDYEHLMALRSRGERLAWGEDDIARCALALGLGRDPLDAAELAFVCPERGLRILPVFAATLVEPRLLDDCGWSPERVVHAGESLVLHRPLDESGSLLLDCDVVGVFDRGAEEGAAIVVEARARRERDAQPLYTLRRTFLARGDGGFGGPRGAVSGGALAGLEAPRPEPSRRPDMTELLSTEPGQALRFRLCHGRELLHADPEVARRMGYAAPPLQALGSLGLACHGLLRVICDYDQTLITALEARFPALVHPGEALVLEMWQDANVVSFRLRSQARDVLVLDQGRCVLATG